MLLGTSIRFEKRLMGTKRHLAAAVVVVRDPRQQKSQLFVLLGLGAVLVRLPWTRFAIPLALLEPRVKEQQLRLIGKRDLDKARVATLNDPLLTRGTKASHIGGGRRWITRARGPSWLPGYTVKIEHRRSVCIAKPAR